MAIGPKPNRMGSGTVIPAATLLLAELTEDSADDSLDSPELVDESTDESPLDELHDDTILP